VPARKNLKITCTGQGKLENSISALEMKINIRKWVLKCKISDIKEIT
jgi:hypothetical protein